MALQACGATVASAAAARAQRRSAKAARGGRTNAVASPGPTLIVSEEDGVMHSLTQERLEILQGLHEFASTDLLKILKPVEKCWQAQDLLPDPSHPGFFDEVKEIQARALEIPDDHLLCLVGDMITEEALPTYMAMLNTLDGVKDETGASSQPWAAWTRQWTAEENRHGDAMNKYLWLTGRVNMRAVEVTIQRLIGSGMNPKTENNPYLGFVYTSFQERATRVSHGNTARFAKEHGDDNLAKLCGLVAADEARHEAGYCKIIEELYRVDPNGAMLAFGDMMRKQIVMPAHMMDDLEHQARTGRDLFTDFSSVAERVGVYTAFDYADILEHLVQHWDVENVKGLNEEGLKEQEYVCTLAPRIRRLAEMGVKRRARAKEPQNETFSWIFDRPVQL